MALPPFASVDDYTDRFGEPGDETRAEAALSDASTDMRSFIGSAMVNDDGDLEYSTATEWAEDVFRKVCCQVAHRRLTNPDGYSSETIAGYTYQQTNESSDTFLKQSEKQALMSALGRSTYGVWSLPTTRNDPASRPDVPTIVDPDPYGVADTYIDVYPPGEPMPFTYEVG